MLESLVRIDKYKISFQDIEWWAPPLRELSIFIRSNVVFTNSDGQALHQGILEGIRLDNEDKGVAIIDGYYLFSPNQAIIKRKEGWFINMSEREMGIWTVYVNTFLLGENELRALAFKLLSIKGAINAKSS